MMSNPRVNILVSTYNGEKYIDDQLKSLVYQEYKNITIYVRDDGSTDKTKKILEKYEKRKQINLIKGENIGFCSSFIELLKNAKEGEYWSFCDQDDIWDSCKVKRAVEYLELEQEKNKPLLYYSYSSMFDENGRDLGIQKPPTGSLEFRRALTGTFGVGFSMVINTRLRELMLVCNPQKVHSHDWLAGAIALGMGKVIVDERVCAKYRRLETSVTRISFHRKMRWFINMLTNQGDVKERNIEFSRCFKNQLSDDKKKYLEWFDCEKYSLKNSLKKTFYPEMWRPSLSSEVCMRILMLIGKV